MSRYQIILIGILAVIMTFSALIYFRINSTPSSISFVPILLWQAVVWSPWLLFGFLNIKLDRRYPIVEQPIHFWILRHSGLSLIIITSHVAWFFIVSGNFSPFLGMDNTGYGAFFFFFIMWGVCDFLFYWALLGIFALRQLLSISPAQENIGAEKPDYFLLKTTGRQSSVAICDIHWIEAEDYCCRVHTKDNNYLVRQSLNSFEKTLPSTLFLRIHRSTIINIKQVDQIVKQENRRHIVRLRNGTERAISPSGRQKLQQILSL
ncbi:MAG: LytTR family transcriptional regulator [Kordiimonadaceae bacterium]|nr:LytTR family transcriptional regulator [Kordiimonadaceae bacterium]MBT6033657.1 LytTR family transcriptional regulator [Kordiimonadaceae bacterium]